MGERIATASVRTGLAMTWYLQGVQCAAGHMGPTPQLSILQGRARVPCRGCGKIRVGPSRTPAPTKAQQEVQWSGDRKGRPYGGVTRSAMR